MTMDDDDLIDHVARVIATRGFGRPWDDFLPVNAFDTDQSDLRSYARAAIVGLRSYVATVPPAADSPAGFGGEG